MGKCIAYTALIIVCLGVGVLIGGAGVHFGKQAIAANEVRTIKASCSPRSSNNFHSSTVEGRIEFSQKMNKERHEELYIDGSIEGLPAGKHGFHVHYYGIEGGHCSTAGGHYNPLNKTHGSPLSPERHIGDLGNIEVLDNNSTKFRINDTVASLFGDFSIMGRSIVIHKFEDTFSGASGNAGERLACCDIVHLKPIVES